MNPIEYIKPIEYIQGAPMVDPEKRKKQKTGRIKTVYLRGVMRFCATYMDAAGRVRQRICSTLEQAIHIMHIAGYNEL